MVARSSHLDATETSKEAGAAGQACPPVLRKASTRPLGPKATAGVGPQTEPARKSDLSQNGYAEKGFRVWDNFASPASITSNDVSLFKTTVL